MNRVLLGFLTLLAIATAVWFVTSRAPRQAMDDDRVHVVASFYPLAHFAEQVGGDEVRVTTITPPGAEPHDYEPTPRQVSEVYEADLLLLNGGGLDGWAEALASDVEQQGVATVEVSALIDTLLPAPSNEEDLRFDPHVWLDPVIAQQEVAIIRDALIQVLPEKAETFTQNANAYIAELQQLDAEFAQGLGVCEVRKAITSHEAFAYLARRYTFAQIPISGLSPEEEPSLKDLAAIVETAKTEGVRYVFFETLVSPEFAETVAREIGGETLVFNPLEGLTAEEMSMGETYLSIMRKNLANLRIAMECT